ncbi:MAG: PIG-L family deacetylase [Actinobacteria bacterium]|nr:PIG-L family deacetylase [Actinomycetota bacterium]
MNEKNKVILAVGAHPDDIEISCSGTLAKYSKTGSKVYVQYFYGR